MKCTRRWFLSSVAITAVSLLAPNDAFADEWDGEKPIGDNASMVVEPIDSTSIRFRGPNGDWTLSVYEDGPCRISAVALPDGTSERVCYDRGTGVVSSTFTGQSFFFGPDESYKGQKKRRGIIDHEAPVIFNGSTRREARYVSYAQLKSLVGAVSDVAGLVAGCAAIIGFSLAGTFVVGFITDNLGFILNALPAGDPNHGLKFQVKLTERYTIHPVTGAHIYYDTLQTCEGVSFY